MTPKDFFEKHIEGYLFEDLKSMQFCTVSMRGYGGCGYPKLMTMLSGIELIGYLLNDKSNKSSEGNFLNFWDKYLSKYNDIYKEKGKFIYNLVRHGLMHKFITKFGIFIGNEDLKLGKRHFWYDKANKQFFIDPTVLFNDLYNCYITQIRPIIFENSDTIKLDTIKLNLSKLLADYEKDTNSNFDNLPANAFLPKNLNINVDSVPLSGASGLQGPLDTTSSGINSGSALTSRTTPPEYWGSSQISGKDISEL